MLVILLLFVYALCFVLGGYLPFSFFQWTHLNGRASHSYISARCYTTNGLCRWFGGMNRELLPLCAVLTGNDYGSPKDAETLISMLDVTELARGGRGRGRIPTSRIEGILLWLSSFSSPTEALEEVSRLMGEEDSKSKRGQKGGLSSQLWAGMQEYNIKSQSSLAHWFSGSKVAPGGRTSTFAQLPECLSQAAAQGLLAPLVLDALVMHRVLLMPQVENSKLASSHCSARAIRQALYGILLQRGQDHVTLGKSGSVPLLRGPGGVVQTQDMKVQGNISQSMRGGRGGRGRGGGRGLGRGGSQGSGGRDQGINLPTQQGVYAGFSSEQASGAATIQAQGCCVEEYDRLDLNLKKNEVEAHPPRTPINLDTLNQVSMITKMFSYRLPIFIFICLGILKIVKKINSHDVFIMSDVDL